MLESVTTRTVREPESTLGCDAIGYYEVVGMKEKQRKKNELNELSQG
jgi:hypothetical protein